MTTVNVDGAKSQLSKLLDMAERGEPVTIARAGRPIADLVPHASRTVVLGMARGQIQFDAETFDDEDDEVLASLGVE